jgi:SlyX protein
MPAEPDDDRFMDLEIKLAYQERLIKDLDALVRAFGARLDESDRKLEELKSSLGPAVPMGPANEPPPHY